MGIASYESLWIMCCCQVDKNVKALSVLRFIEPSGVFLGVELERSLTDRSVSRPIVPQKAVEPAMLLRATTLVTISLGTATVQTVPTVKLAGG